MSGTSAYIRLQRQLRPWVNPNEAPPGYRAEAKATMNPCPPNHCRRCDFREHCNIAEHPCSSHKREDGQSVVFKKEGDPCTSTKST